MKQNTIMKQNTVMETILEEEVGRKRRAVQGYRVVDNIKKWSGLSLVGCIVKEKDRASRRTIAGTFHEEKAQNDEQA